MDTKIYNRLMPLFEVADSVQYLIAKNDELEAENAHLKERLKWFEDSLEANAKESAEAVHSLISACLDDRIQFKDGQTIITSHK